MTRASLIANFSTPLSADGRELRALPPSVEFVELRPGLVDPEWVRRPEPDVPLEERRQTVPVAGTHRDHRPAEDGRRPGAE